MKQKILAGVAALAVSLLAYSAPAHAAHGVGNGKPPKVTAHNSHPVDGVQGIKGQPDRKATASKLLVTCPCFNYAKGQQTFTSGYPNTVQGKALISSPYVQPTSGNHSLMELAVTHHETSGKRNIVEVGWTKDPSVCTASTTNPCMFVFSWVNDVPQGYGTGFVRYTGSGASAYGPGDSLSALVGTAHVFGIQLDVPTGNVWVYFASATTNEWVGYYPASVWTAGGFTMTSWDTIQPFAEVADVNTDKPCTDMGTGDLATATVGGYWTQMNHNATAAPSFTWSVAPSGIGSEYNAATVSGTTARLGGPGWNSAGTGVGTKGSC